jgi:predicted dehydrogenase
MTIQVVSFVRASIFLSALLVCVILGLPAGQMAAEEKSQPSPESAAPLRLAVAGLVHGHVQGFLNQLAGRKDVVLVGIAEHDASLATKYAAVAGIKPGLIFTDLGKMLDETHPQAVAAFTSTLGHLEVVRACSVRRIHVMMEKPLAVSIEQGREMAQLAREARIQLIVNYETTWYASNSLAYATMINNKKLGEIRKVVIHDGHSGPKEIGCPDEFLRWLTDPVENGAGALFDFGCYGANLATWLMGNQRPLAVTAVTQQIKPDIYPKVDDEATIVLAYPKAQVIIQASWNWPYGRKDMEVYGTTGTFFCDDREQVRMRLGSQAEQKRKADPLLPPLDDSLDYLAAVAQGKLQPSGLSSLENNLIVTEILDAARRSAQTGTTIRLQTP